LLGLYLARTAKGKRSGEKSHDPVCTDLVDAQCVWAARKPIDCVLQNAPCARNLSTENLHGDPGAKPVFGRTGSI